MEPLEEEAEAGPGFQHRQAAAETATPGRAPVPLPAPCPPQAPPARARGRAGGRGVPGDRQWPQRPGERAFAMLQRGVKPPGPPGGGGVGGRGGGSRHRGTCTPERADAVELEQLLVG